MLKSVPKSDSLNPDKYIYTYMNGHGRINLKPFYKVPKGRLKKLSSLDIK